MKKNNKGFTLVELIAVIVILIIIILLAVTKVKSAYIKSKKDAVKVSALSYVKALNNSMSFARNENRDLDDGEYSLSQLSMFDVYVEGTLPEDGTFNIQDSTVVSGCLDYKNYSANIISPSKIEVIETFCTGEERGSGTPTPSDTDIEYSEPEVIYAVHGIYEYIVPKKGTYLMEVWGAQGGESELNSKIRNGGPGGYTYAEVSLDKGEEIYLIVGEKGIKRINHNTLDANYLGSFNGGGKLCTTTSSSYNATGGGGASHISYDNGVLSSSSSVSVFVVAGGGGGASIVKNMEYGDAGGGYLGVQTCTEPRSAKATQTSGAKFGTALATSNCYDNSGGGGWYGGSSCFSNYGSGSGGSGHINFNLVSEGYMTCYNCDASPEGETQITYSNTCVSEEPTKDCAKLGDGAAHIKFLR